MSSIGISPNLGCRWQRQILLHVSWVVGSSWMMTRSAICSNMSASVMAFVASSGGSALGRTLRASAWGRGLRASAWGRGFCSSALGWGLRASSVSFLIVLPRSSARNRSACSFAHASAASALYPAGAVFWIRRGRALALLGSLQSNIMSTWTRCWGSWGAGLVWTFTSSAFRCEGRCAVSTSKYTRSSWAQQRRPAIHRPGGKVPRAMAFRTAFGVRPRKAATCGRWEIGGRAAARISRTSASETHRRRLPSPSGCPVSPLPCPLPPRRPTPHLLQSSPRP
jgi:hypothetical protein